MSNNVLQIQKNSSSNVQSNNNIIFDDIINSEGDISYNITTGVITLSTQGLYIIDWYVSTQTAGATSKIAFKLVSNNGDEFYSNTVNKTSSISGIANINVVDSPIEISLVNASNATVDFPSAIISKANLRVVYIGNNSVTDDYSCFGLNQFANIINQLVDKYPGAAVTIYSSILGSITATIDSVYKAANAGSIPLLIIDQGGAKVAININEITVLYFANSVYDDTISYIQPPIQFPTNCRTDLLKDIYSYISVGDEISINAGPVTTASGTVHINEYGIIVLSDATSFLLLIPSNLVAISVDSTPAGIRGTKNIKPITISNNSIGESTKLITLKK